MNTVIFLVCIAWFVAIAPGWDDSENKRDRIEPTFGGDDE